MKVMASVKKMCRYCKVIKRNGVVRVICTDPLELRVVEVLDLLGVSDAHRIADGACTRTPDTVDGG